MLYRRNRIDAAVIFIGAVGASGCIQAAVTMLSQGVVQGTCALFPTMSCLFFYLFVRSDRDFLGFTPVRTAHPGEGEEGGMRLGSAAFVLLFILAGCYGFFFARMHAMWIPAQDMWGSAAIQVSSAGGALLACAALAGVTALPNRRMSMLLCECLMLAFAFFSIYLSSVHVEGLPTIYLAPFNAAQKTLIYLCFFACLALPDPNRKMAGFCLLFAALRSSNILFRLLDDSAAAPVIDPLYVGAMVLATILLVVVMAHPDYLPDLVPGRRRDAEAEQRDENPAGKDIATERYKSIAFYFLFGQKYALTQREIELLPLLMRDYGAKEIANELSISQATAKTHIRNIYQKLAVHNRDGLAALIEADKVSLFEHLPEWYLEK